MGIIRKQDKALTVEQLLGIVGIMEKDWQSSTCEEEKKEIKEIAAFVIISFCVPLRGEETPMTLVDGMAEFWKETRGHRIPMLW